MMPPSRRTPAKSKRRQRLRIDDLLAEIARAHVGDDAALLQKVIEPLALDHREPPAEACILQRLDEIDVAPCVTARERGATVAVGATGFIWPV